MEQRSPAHWFLLTMITALLFAPSPSRARPAASPRPPLLSVSAPTGADEQSVGAWYNLHVPARFRARQAVSVSLLTDEAMTVYLQSDGSGESASSDDDGDIDGVFEDGPPSITLRLPPDGVPDTLTFAHEYGHYVWFDILSGGDRKHYRAIYDRQKAADSLVTDYAGDSVEEGFAEAFSYYVAQPDTLAQRDPLSFAFLSTWPGK